VFQGGDIMPFANLDSYNYNETFKIIHEISVEYTKLITKDLKSITATEFYEIYKNSVNELLEHTKIH
jgi:hypothetical protein